MNKKHDPKDKTTAEIEHIFVKEICDEISAPNLTVKQRRYANVLLCPHLQGMTISQLAEKANVSLRYAKKLNKTYAFRMELDRFTKYIPKSYKSEIIAKLTQVAINTGSIPHAEFLFEYAGVFVRVSRNINANLNDKYKSLTDKELEKMVKNA